MALATALSLTSCTRSPIATTELRTEINAGETAGGIIGGTEADGSEDFSKTVVAIMDSQRGKLCTASILSESVLVTAAHCVSGPPASLKVVFGTDIHSPTRIIRQVNDYQTTPIWPLRHDEDYDTGDVAVVSFDGGIPEGYHAVEFISESAALVALVKNATVMLAGFGLTDGVSNAGAGKLRYVETAIADPAFSETEILVDQTQGKGACHGDSGGPAFIKIDNRWKLWGITNRGINDKKNDCSQTASYASILVYKNWILKAANKISRR